jgi:hypothetical protein
MLIRKPPFFIKVGLSLLLCVLFGCSSDLVQEELPSSGYVALYVMAREPIFGLTSYPVEFDGFSVGNLKYNEYFIFLARMGKHEFKVGQTTKEVDIQPRMQNFFIYQPHSIYQYGIFPMKFTRHSGSFMVTPSGVKAAKQS